MKKGFIVLLCCLLSIAALATAQAYANNPPFNPQRTIHWSFDSAQWWIPETIVGPTWDQGDWVCDDVSPIGSPIQYFDGYIGVDNTAGLEYVIFDLVFHVNNYDNNNPIKYIWDEAIYAFSYEDSFEVIVPEGYTADWDIINETPVENAIRDNMTGTIEKNPPWEEFVWHFNVAPGETAYIYDFCLSTQCVPEPSSFIVLAAGLGILGRTIIRRRK